MDEKLESFISDFRKETGHDPHKLYIRRSIKENSIPMLSFIIDQKLRESDKRYIINDILYYDTYDLIKFVIKHPEFEHLIDERFLYSAICKNVSGKTLDMIIVEGGIDPNHRKYSFLGTMISNNYHSGLEAILKHITIEDGYVDEEIEQACRRGLIKIVMILLKDGRFSFDHVDMKCIKFNNVKKVLSYSKSLKDSMADPEDDTYDVYEEFGFL